jgi:hypothetical protein
VQYVSGGLRGSISWEDFRSARVYEPEDAERPAVDTRGDNVAGDKVRFFIRGGSRPRCWQKSVGGDRLNSHLARGERGPGPDDPSLATRRIHHPRPPPPLPHETSTIGRHNPPQPLPRGRAAFPDIRLEPREFARVLIGPTGNRRWRRIGLGEFNKLLLAPLSD